MNKNRYTYCFLKPWLLFLWLTLCLPTLQSQVPEHTPRYYVNRIQGFIDANAWNEAKRVIDEALVDYPDDPELRYLNGRYYYMSGMLNDARYNLIRATQIDDQHYGAKRILVDVEDDSGHYSSAICYINELLEFQPYDKDLWRRKIGLYRKMNNHTEADASLERLARIYPNDTIISNDLRNRRRINSNTVLQKNSLEDAAVNLEQWLELDPRNLEYYLELINTYQRLGEFDRAIGTANRGLTVFPGRVELLNKLTGLMTDQGLMTQALDVARRSAPNSTLYRYMLEELASDNRLRDPYESNARFYDETHNEDALTYLINTAMTRGYYDDASHYLQEAMRLHGRTTDLLMKQYALEKRFGKEGQSLKILQELYEKIPEDEELNEEYAGIMLELGNREMTLEDWEDANLHLKRAIELMSVDDEAWPAAASRRIVCLGRQGLYNEARAQYREAVTADPIHRNRYAAAFEEVMGNRFRYLIEEEMYLEVLKEAQEYVSMMPDSELGIRTCINMSQTLGLEDSFQVYAQQGFDSFPDEPYFIIKQAVSLEHQKRFAEALELLNPPYVNEEYALPLMTSTRSGITEEWTSELLKNHHPKQAIEVADIALQSDPDNKELLYAKGLAYEQLKEFSQAYTLQKRYYEPSNAEQQEFYQHMRWLRFKGFKNLVDASYTHAAFDSRGEEVASMGHLYSVASVSYTRIGKKDSFTGQVSYKGIDGYHYEKLYLDENYEEQLEQEHSPGGFGLEFMGQWEHAVNSRLTATLSGAFSTKFFNKYGANLTLSYEMNKGWTPSVRFGYRRTSETYLYLSATDSTAVDKSQYNLFILTPALEKEWTERISTRLSIDLASMRSDIYYNVGMKGKLFINDDNISSVSLMAGIGSFPELNFFDQTALKELSHTNAMVGFDAQYLLTENLYLGLSGSWNTYYSPYRTLEGILVDSYRNIYSLTLQLHVAF
ncbi:MAG: tetratricopeptide repeat protein [Bacteroidaceae bacterium]|nr:tetratricopeptide repeat protein [Bacteroidaceae bacterium]